MSQEGNFQSRDGLEFFERRWDPSDDTQANLVLLHGYAEHSGRYGGLADALNGAGIAVHTYDQRGHGRSPGKRGYIHAFDTLLDDVDAYLAHIRPRLEGKPWFLMGHSMGGLVLTAYAQTRSPDVRGFVFSSPLLAIADNISPTLIALANVLGVLTPWLPVASLDTTGLSRDPDAVKAYETDPLIYHGKIVARTGAQFNTAIQRARANFAAISAPAYVFHGAEDRLAPTDGGRALHEGIASSDKTLKIYDGGYHELLNDLEKQTVTDDLVAWLTPRLST